MEWLSTLQWSVYPEMRQGWPSAGEKRVVSESHALLGKTWEILLKIICYSGTLEYSHRSQRFKMSLELLAGRMREFKTWHNNKKKFNIQSTVPFSVSFSGGLIMVTK